jgi:hypothetical protein
MRRTQCLGQKSFHTQFACPITGFHTSCELDALLSSPSPDHNHDDPTAAPAAGGDDNRNGLGCYCHMMDNPSVNCMIIHLSPHLERYFEDPLVEYDLKIMKEIYLQQRKYSTSSASSTSSPSHAVLDLQFKPMTSTRNMSESEIPEEENWEIVSEMLYLMES